MAQMRCITCAAVLRLEPVEDHYTLNTVVCPDQHQIGQQKLSTLLLFTPQALKVRIYHGCLCDAVPQDKLGNWTYIDPLHVDGALEFNINNKTIMLRAINDSMVER